MEKCIFCEEDILPNEKTSHGSIFDHTGKSRLSHVECGYRSAVGGIGHLLDHAKWCSGPDSDPDAGLTYRQSSKLVWAYTNFYRIDISNI